MHLKSNKKMSYIPPKVEVIRMILETVIAASPIREVNLKDWEYESPDTDPNNNVDVILYF